MTCFRKYFCYAFGAIVGGYVVIHIGAAAFFSTSTVNLVPFTIPLALAAIASGILSYFNQSHSTRLALCVAAPTIFLSALMEILLIAEGRGDWGWIYISAVVIAVCFVSAGIAAKIARFTKK